MSGRLIFGDGDAQVEFLARCGKCGKAVKAELIVAGKRVKVPCICDCQDKPEDDGKERTEKALAECFGSRRQWGTFDEDDGGSPGMKFVQNLCQHFTGDDNGYGLLLFGPPDQGKTFAAESAADCLVRKGHKVIMRTSAEFLGMAQTSMWRTYWLDELSTRYSLVVIDDLGAERGSDFAQSSIFSLIDALYSARVPMIVTTNATREQMAKPQTVAEQRLYGRLLERCLPVEFDSGRSRGTRESQAEIKAALGVGGE